MTARALAHLRALWPRGFGWPLAPFAAFLVVQLAGGWLRPIHLVVTVAVAALAWATPATKRLLLALYPFGLVAVLFEGMRPFQKVGLSPSRILLCDLRAVEAKLFGFGVGGGHGTLHDVLQPRATPALDLLCAFPYGTFIVACIATTVFLSFRDPRAMRRFAWGFFTMNAIAFTLYHLVPAAPPWYFHTHGCTVDLATRAWEGPNLVRVDAMLGVPFFHGMYGQASSVFGAIPSLHCAYPVLILLEGARAMNRPFRVLAALYAGLMIFAAVYLDHHWVVDAVVGVLVALTASRLVRAVERRLVAREPAPAPSGAPEAPGLGA